MLNGQRVIVVLPAYNAEFTLERTVREVDRTVVDAILVVDDASNDRTVEVASRLRLDVIRHQHNRGYGGNQKTCYRAAVEMAGDVVVMLHPDYQYSPRLVTSLASMLACGEYDVALASRILGGQARGGGMPGHKYLANRILTATQNAVLGAKLSEYHTGYRAFTRKVLTSLRLSENSDDFIFDNQMIAQILALKFRVGEISCPTRYAPDSSSIDFRRSVQYGLGVLRTTAQCRLHLSGLRHYEYLAPAEPDQHPREAEPVRIAG